MAPSREVAPLRRARSIRRPRRGAVALVWVALFAILCGAGAAEAAADLVPISMKIVERERTYVRLEWTVHNQGADAATGGWLDYVFVSPSATCCEGAIFVGALNWPSPLAAGAEYTAPVTVQVPQLPLGDYHLIVRVNGSERLAEASTANNDIARPYPVTPLVNVQVWPFDMVVPDVVTTQQPMSVTWKVLNSFPGLGEDATAPLWQDNVYLSPNPVCCDGAIFLGSWPHEGGLLLNRAYTQTATVTVPNVPAGNYHVIVWTDATDAQAEVVEDNAASVPITVTSPDLVATSLRAPGTSVVAAAGQALPVSWSVSNLGTGPALIAWQDALYISSTPTCCDGAIPLGTWPSPTTNLVPHGSYTQSRTISVPALPAGSYYLVVRANATGALHEEREDNSTLAIPLAITTADLVPTTLAAPASAVAGQTISVSWTVRNQGTGPTIGTWADALYVSPTESCCADAVLIGRWERSALAAGASYTQTKTITVPDLAAGTYHLVLRTDADIALFEASDGNNQRVVPITITTPDLVPTALAAPSTAVTQQSVTVSWSVKNQGTATTSRTWTDALYLSPSPACCAGAVPVGQWMWQTPLASGATYTQTKTVTIPSVAAGSYHLVLVSDAAATLPEAQDGNNQRAAPIAISTANLSVAAMSAPPTADAGRAITVSWTVRNQGAGAASVAWADKVFLSASSACCGGITSLGSWPRPAALAPGASYTQTKTVTLPALAAGPYYLTVWADADGQAHEADETDNRRAVTVAVASTTVPPPSIIAIAAVAGSADPNAAAAFPVVVQARDLGGVPRNVKTATTVRLSVKTGTGALGGTLTGTIPVGASQVTIAGVTYRKAESGVVLSAARTSGDALSAGNSAPFTVAPGPVTAYTVALTSPQPAGAAFDVTVTARDQFANTVGADGPVVTLRSTSGHVLFDVDRDGRFGDAARALEAGVLRARAQGTRAETTSVTATDAAGKTGSAPLTIVAGPAAALVFSKQPGNAAAGAAIPGPPTVQVQDAGGNPVSSTTSILLSLGAHPSGATLGGTTTRVAMAGVATFSGVTIDRAGSGYMLVASAPGLASAVSSAFAITASTGGIAGRVTRAGTGDPIAAATVEALVGSALKASTTSGADGTYSLSNLAPGSYIVRATAAGYQGQTLSGIAASAGSTATTNFSLTAATGPSIRITSPAPGSAIDRPVVLVRGEISALATEIGVSVNGVAAMAAGTRFAALIPLEVGTQAITALLSGPSVAIAQDSVTVQVAPMPMPQQVVLTASPRTGSAPLTVTLQTIVRGSVSDYRWDIDGDGTVDESGASLGQTAVQYVTPGLYIPRVTVHDTQGNTVSAEVPILVLGQGGLVTALTAKWNQFRDALRVGNVTAALEMVAASRRDQYREMLQHLTVPLSQIDLVLADLRFVNHRGNTMEFEMIRTDERGRLSYLVRFAIDTDGIWRIKDL